MAVFINPLNDFFFRFLMGSPGNEDVCRAFINAVLADAGFSPATRLAVRNPFNLKTEKRSKESITDIKAETRDGRIFDIEVQIDNRSDFEKRVLFYWAKIYAAQLPEGRLYGELNPVIVINVLDYIKWPQIKRAHSCFLLTEKQEPEYALTDDLVIHFLEVPKFKDYKEGLVRDLRAWLEYLASEGRKKEDEMQILIKNQPELQKAHKLYQRFTATPEYLEVYEARQKWRRDRLSDLAEAERRGIERTARNLLNMGLSLEQIAQASGLSLAEIEKLKD